MARRSRIWGLSYRLLGGLVELLSPHLSSLRTLLRQGGVRIYYKAYVSCMLFCSILAASIAFPSSFIVFHSLLGYPITRALMISALIAIASSCSVILGFLVHPLNRAGSEKRRIEMLLPYIVSYMAVLSASGLPPEHIFEIMASSDPSFAVNRIAGIVVREIKFFGKDILSAISTGLDYCPSPTFRTILSGMARVIRSRGSLRDYLLYEARNVIALKRAELRKIAEAVGYLAELFVIIAVTAPILFVITLSVMAMVGGELFGISPVVLIFVMIYLLVPLISFMLLLMLNVIIPSW
ncbi:MAG: hypothetical protein DRN15_01210 [Thermoprotei archaeon]|nr:MAG: hypothetical protein DRN15_01210 [Thermoprotei archaeon]RLF25807.1 MAG: hypothetical protein DRM97_00605 [Thermoprotei archaeon]